MKTKTLSIELPRIDADTQSRIKINDETVADYAELLESVNSSQWPFEPIDVFHDGTDHYVADGFHRLLAGLQTKRGTIPCRVHSGTAWDALIFGMTANDRHGLRRTHADKRANVERLLDSGIPMSQKEIAGKAGVSKRLVQTVVADRKYKALPPEPKPDKRGAEAHGALVPTGDTESEPSCPTCNSSELFSDGVCVACGPSEPVDLGKCPACAGAKWTDTEDGPVCSKCKQPHGEPAGDADEDRIKTQKAKTRKTAEALMRAFDDLQCMQARPEHEAVIKDCKRLIVIAQNWK